MPDPLPIDEILPELRATLAAGRALVLTAPPGAGKSTRVPPLLVGLSTKQVYLLQPRRLAAKALARRIAHEQGWQLGREVGFRVRFEKSGGPATRLWVMTEGSLTRQLQADPYLDGVGVVILDEFHERSLHTDLALSYLRELQRTVREDLVIVVMSATMDARPVAEFLGGCAVVESPGRMFPVITSHWQGAQDLAIGDTVARCVAQARLDPECGDILVFLAGMGEIRACQRALEGVQGVDVLPLHGSLPPEEQDRALSPGPRARIVLATNVAETSVTIPGVRTVIDSGQSRVLRHDPGTGLDELRLQMISRQSAAQRAGRAGRTAPGRCIRLWTPLADGRLEAATAPEIRRVDLAPVTLALKGLGYADTRTFPWFDPPEAVRGAAAEELLHLLGALTAPYAGLTQLGERLAGLPLHPRLGRLLHAAAQAQCPQLGATLAALAGERDVRLPPRHDEPPADPAPCDALERLELLADAVKARFAGHLRSQGIDPGACAQVVQARDEILAAWGGGWRQADRERTADPDLICRLLLTAYPDRVAKRSGDARASGDANRAALAGGVAIEIDRGSALHAAKGQERAPLLVATELQELMRAGKPVVLMRQGAEIEEAWLAELPGGVRREERLAYDAERGRVVSAIRWMYRDLAVREAPGQPGDAAAASTLLADALAPQARALLLGPEDGADEAQLALRSWLARVAWLRRELPDLGLPELGDADLAELVRELCAGCTTRAEVAAKPALDWLAARLDRSQQQAVAEHAPERFTVPTGNAIRLQYGQDGAPVLAVRLQELFGLTATPRLARGRVPILLHLLAPNYRVEQITQDLASFWANTYPQVRKDLRARYPKHSWPDDPLTAPPQARGRPRQ
jgi:ATP-dependent helicase HrpB